MKKYIISLSLVLITIFFFKLFFSSHFSTTTSGYSGFSKETAVDYLFIGSSQTRQGLNPYILEDSLKKGYIIAYNGNSFFYMDLILEAALTTKVKLKKLIVEAYPYRAFQKTGLSDQRLFNDLDFASKFRFIRKSRKIFTTWDIYDLLMLEGNERILTYPLLKNFDNSLSYKGGYTGKNVEGVSAKQFSQFKPPYPDTTTFVQLELNQIAAINNIVSEAKKHRLELIFLEPPVPEQIRTSKIYILAHNSLMAYIQAKGCIYLDMQDYKFENSNSLFFHDAVHLSSAGRDAYTRSILKFIR